IGHRAGIHGERQERHPVRDDGEAAQRRRLELLEDDPVADDVLDAVGHHRAGEAQEESPIAAVTQRHEGARLGSRVHQLTRAEPVAAAPSSFAAAGWSAASGSLRERNGSSAMNSTTSNASNTIHSARCIMKLMAWAKA